MHYNTVDNHVGAESEAQLRRPVTLLLIPLWSDVFLSFSMSELRGMLKLHRKAHFPLISRGYRISKMTN